PDSVALIARLAANTGRMRIGITVFLLALHNPVDIAEQVATLDAISHGRMIFGVGLAYRPEECAAYGITMQERVPRCLESLEIIKRLWTEDELEFHGRFYKLPRVQSTIRPVQKPHQPIWMAANQAVAVRRVGQLGLTWVMNPHVTTEVLKHLETTPRHCTLTDTRRRMNCPCCGKRGWPTRASAPGRKHHLT